MPQSDPGTFEAILKYGWTALIVVFGVVFKSNKELHARISASKDDVSHMKDDLADFKLKVAQENVTKDDFKDMMREVRDGFGKIEDKIEKLLQSKADKK